MPQTVSNTQPISEKVVVQVSSSSSFSFPIQPSDICPDFKAVARTMALPGIEAIREDVAKIAGDDLDSMEKKEYAKKYACVVSHDGAGPNLKAVVNYVKSGKADDLFAQYIINGERKSN